MLSYNRGSLFFKHCSLKQKACTLVGISRNRDEQLMYSRVRALKLTLSSLSTHDNLPTSHYDTSQATNRNRDETYLMMVCLLPLVVGSAHVVPFEWVAPLLYPLAAGDDRGAREGRQLSTSLGPRGYVGVTELAIDDSSCPPPPTHISPTHSIYPITQISPTTAYPKPPSLVSML